TVLNQYYETIQYQDKKNKVKVSKKESTPETLKKKRKLISFSIFVIFVLVILLSLFFFATKKERQLIRYNFTPSAGYHTHAGRNAASYS
ncbi:unnamed protein product, partial [marine sediment metagenome]